MAVVQEEVCVRVGVLASLAVSLCSFGKLRLLRGVRFGDAQGVKQVVRKNWVHGLMMA